mgnify:CR=1 FL=1
MKKLFPFLKPYRLQLTVGPFFKLSEAVLELLIPTLMALLIDNGVNMGNRSYIIKMGILMLVIATFGVIFAFICQYSASIASQGFGTDVRNAMFKKIGTLSFAQLDKFGTPSLINRITGDVTQLQSAVAMLIRLVIRAPFLCVGGLVMAIMIDLKLSIIFMIVIPLFILVLFLVMFKAVPLYKSVQKKLDSLTLVLRENLSGVRVIRAFAGVKREKERFNDRNTDYANTAIRVGKIAALTNPLTTIIMNLAAIAVIYFGGIRVNTGHLSQGEVIAFINYITQILNAMIVVANLVVLYTKAYASALRVGEVLETEPLIEYGEKNTTQNGENAVEFKNVSFKYPDADEYILKNISFKAKKGDTLALIGSTGSGKSTIVNLIMRFYDATEGEILIDGKNIKEYKLDALYKKIGYVPQRAVMFNGSVKYNISYGDKKVSEKDMKNAARIAQASEFIDKMPKGYDANVSSGGTNISGGQKQRLAIARAVAKDPEIFVFDDSFSALDYKTDYTLRKELKKNAKDKTNIIVAQRIGTILNADEIIVLENGFVKGCGTHAELLKKCKVYKEIALSQLSKEELENE